MRLLNWLYDSGCMSSSEAFPREAERLQVSQAASLEQLVLVIDTALRIRARVTEAKNDSSQKQA